MISCWEYLPANRPSFQLIVSLLKGEKLKKKAPSGSNIEYSPNHSANGGKVKAKKKEEGMMPPKKIKKGGSVDITAKFDGEESFEPKTRVSTDSASYGSKLPSLRAVTHLTKK